jgi:hypothetical protein
VLREGYGAEFFSVVMEIWALREGAFLFYNLLYN